MPAHQRLIHFKKFCAFLFAKVPIFYEMPVFFRQNNGCFVFFLLKTIVSLRQKQFFDYLHPGISTMEF